MKLKIYTAMVAAVILAVAGAEEKEPETETEIWNRGVELYRAGDVTNALATLKNLTLSKEYGPRAAEVVGALEYAQASAASGEAAAAGSEPALRALEASAQDLQLALRANPDDPRANRNFTRATDRIPALREQAHVEEVMKRLGQQDPGSLLGAGVKDARALLKEFPVALTNPAPAAIAKCEAMAKRLERIADSWIPLKAAVAQSVTNEQQAMTITAQVEDARKATLDAAAKAGDLDFAALADIAKSETALNRFWKLVIMPPAACDEDIRCMSNTVEEVETVGGRDWQAEALDFTREFRSKFPMWAQQYEQQAQADTNKPPFTKEAQAEISSLSTEVEKMQINITSGPASTNGPERVLLQEDVLQRLNRIRELLPKDNSGGNGQNQQNQQQDQKQDQQKQDQNQDQKQDQQQDQDQKQDDQKQDDQKQEDQKQEEQKSEEDKRSDEQVEATLRKAQERSDEHENEKKARMKSMQLPPNERDW